MRVVYVFCTYALYVYFLLDVGCFVIHLLVPFDVCLIILHFGDFAFWILNACLKEGFLPLAF